ncbi:glutaredoxin family protein [Mesobacillus maritimus]|uniref:glutaredoxin family protein n=1 Tax=Mesobacillus maritimus TaxID=1643336 RepID=UPI00203D482A|nr:glutaredoxin family protein [Mesobacillus maritimus]MCM3586252.1 glutaredoxin family protein [Mesobacillus maritimus]MCM3667579.1 glutaredoxin family protein [Mesobacillus maritimus]
MNKPIVYTQNDCPPCKIVKMFLNEYQIEFVEKNISDDPTARKELTQTYGAYSTPTVIVENEVIIGFDLKKLELALNLTSN